MNEFGNDLLTDSGKYSARECQQPVWLDAFVNISLQVFMFKSIWFNVYLVIVHTLSIGNVVTT